MDSHKIDKVRSSMGTKPNKQGGGGVVEIDR